MTRQNRVPSVPTILDAVALGLLFWAHHGRPGWRRALLPAIGVGLSLYIDIDLKRRRG
jgi:hypothetical protein